MKTPNVIVSAFRAFSMPFAIVIKLSTMLAFIIKERFKTGRKGRGLIFEETIKQIYFTGVMSIGLVTVLGVLIGVLSGIQLSFLVAAVGNSEVANRIFYDVVVRELAPIAAACVVIARSASAISVELATLSVNDELDAYKSQGINWTSLLLYPRLIGVITSTVMLSAYFAAASLLASVTLVVIRSDVTFMVFLQRVLMQGDYKDVVVLVVKGILNGMAIALLSFYCGLNIKRSMTEIPRVASKVVVNCFFAVVVFSSAISILTYR